MTDAVNNHLHLGYLSEKYNKNLATLIQENNLDLDEILDAHEATQANVDPVVQNLQQTVAQLQAQVGQSQQTQQAAQHQANLADVQSFMSERDATNSLKRPYLTEVTDAWASQITAVRSTNPNLSNTEVLQKAYENACWASPEVRGKMQAETEQVRRTQEAQRVQQARIAGSSVTGAPVDNTAARNPQNNNLSLRDELTAQFAAQGV